MIVLLLMTSDIGNIISDFEVFDTISIQYRPILRLILPLWPILLILMVDIADIKN